MKAPLAIALLALGGAAMVAARAATDSAPLSQPASAAADWLEDAMSRLDLAPAVQPLRLDKPGKPMTGEIDWARGEIIAIGEGQLKAMTNQQLEMAMRAARLVALRNSLVVLMGGIDTGPGGTVPAIKEGTIQLDAVVKDFQEVSRDYDEKTNRAVVKLRVPLCGVKGVLKLSGVVLRRPPARFAWPAAPEGQAAQAQKIVVIDAFDTTIGPCLLPRLADEDGKVLLDATDFGPDTLASRMMVVFCRRKTAGAESAQPQAQKPGDAVLTLKAAKADQGTITLDKASIQSLTAVAGARQALREGRVIVICPAAP